MRGLLKKTIQSLKKEGLKAAIKKAYLYVGKHVVKICPPESEVTTEIQVEPVSIYYPPFVDVLFINGCDNSVPHPARYRVTHQREQLMANNITSDEVYYVDLQIEQVKYANFFIFFRCPYTEVIGQFIELAKSLNKAVWFDIDDLVIDTVYTDRIPYIQAMSGEEKALYDDGVNRMGHTLRLCEGAITTTERLAFELKKYVPEVYINRNTASEQMYMLSEQVNRNRTDEEIRIGYFSGSITHNEDFRLVMPALCVLLQKYENLRLYVVGELQLPEELAQYREKVVCSPFLDWKKLPQLIASVDINLAPLEKSIFNEAKSENKWVEAALVKVPTVASNVGAFARMIQQGVTGFLCDTTDEWIHILEQLIQNRNFREKIALQAYEYVKKKCITLYSGGGIAKYIMEKMKPSAVFVLPSTEISGGIMVVLKHAVYMQKAGYNVTILANQPSLQWMDYEDCHFPVVSYGENPVYAYFDKAIATMWTTTPFVETHPKIKDRYYLVQNFEVDFYEPGTILRLQANQTYHLGRDIIYLTISRWCQDWLKKEYGKVSRYAPNGITIKDFYVQKRIWSGKIRILIEGDCAVAYKRVDESFQIANQLDREKYEVWYMSYNETPKVWYRYDRFLHRVAYSDVPNVYRACNILLKSSVLESFSYPPLEMMATGGFVVAVANGGNMEYLRDEYNCLFYESGNEKQALECIERIVSDPALRETLLHGAEDTVRTRDWGTIKEDICRLYDIEPMVNQDN